MPSVLAATVPSAAPALSPPLRAGPLAAAIMLRARNAWRRGGAAALAVLVAVLIVAALGLADVLPGPVRVGVVSVTMAAVLLLAARGLRSPPPPVGQGLLWLEQATGLRRGALAVLSTAPAGPTGDRLGATLWSRERARVASLRPRVRLRRLGSTAAFAAGVGLAAAGAIVLAPDRIGRALSPWPHDLRPLRLALVVEPPAWTGAPVRRVPLAIGATAPLRVLRGSRVAFSVEGVAAPWRLNGDAGLARTVEAPGTLRLHIGPRTVARVPVALAPDSRPDIAWLAPPRATPAGALALAWRLRDDNPGVALGILLARGTEVDRLWQPGRWSSGDGQRLVDLARHPWAGQDAQVRLLARDGAGQVAFSDPVMLRLPERAFAHPVAREVIAARARLLDNPTTRLDVAQQLLEIASEPERLGGRLAPFAGLSASARRLAASEAPEAVRSGAELMWEVAVAIEDDGAGAALDRLARALAGLEEALASAGGDAAVREALAELARAADEAVRAAATGPTRPASAGELELARALAAELADRLAAGDRAGARAMIAALRRAIEDQRAGGAGSMAAAEALRQAQAARALAERQRALARQTGQAAAGGLPALAAPQGALAGEAGREAGLERAAGAMATARDALARGDRPAAEAAQRAAADALDTAAQALEAQAAAALPALSRDPLGRPGGGSAAGDVRIGDPERARRLEAIRAELRERASDPDRPAAERAYYLRLLRRF